jgi:SAM-dependent methyltransferase
MFSRLQKKEQPIVNLNEIQQNALNEFKLKLNQKIYTLETVACVCNSNDGLLIAQTDRYGLPVDTYLCRNCGTMWTNPRLDQDSLVRFYEEDYRPIYVGNPQSSEFFFDEQIKHGKIIYQWISSNINLTENFTVFDIGCGAGGILIPFKEFGCATYGCDLGKDYLEKGKKEGLFLEYGNEESLKKYSPAQLIILSHVLEHFPNPLKSLKSISQLLENNGYIYIELPGILSIHQTYGDILLFLQNAHLYHFTLSTLTFLMNEAGFSLVKGDEYIHALFKKEDKVNKYKFKNNFIQVYIYIFYAEIQYKTKFYKITNSIKLKITQFIKKMLGQKLVTKLKQKLGRF